MFPVRERRIETQASAARCRNAALNPEPCTPLLRDVLNQLRPAFPVLGRPLLVPHAGLQQRALSVYQRHVPADFPLVGVQIRSAAPRARVFMPTLPTCARMHHRRNAQH